MIMDKKFIDLKTYFKENRNISLYKKEQLAICTMVLCFALSGIGLPVLKEQLAPANTPDKLEMNKSEKKDANYSDKNKKNPHATESSTENPTENSEGYTSENNADTGVDSKQPSASSSQESSNVPTTDNTTTQPSENTNDTDTETSANTSEPDSSGKVWVPPVYKTIHHEAVYETRQVYICSGFINENAEVCNQVFNSLEEWGTHKSINGG